MVGLASRIRARRWARARAAWPGPSARAPIRSASRHVTEPHARGAILVSASVRRVSSPIYVQRTRDLMRIARAGGAVERDGDLHPDLAERLASEATRIAGHISSISASAPSTIARLSTCSSGNSCARHHRRFRPGAGRSVRLSRGADQGLPTAGDHTRKVKSYSEEALRWCPPEVTGKSLGPCEGLEYSILDLGQEASAAERDKQNAIILNAYATQNAQPLGLDRTAKIQVFSFHPIHRISPDGRVIVDFVVEFLQVREEPLDPSVEGGPMIAFRGGSTVIFDSKGHVRYVIEKSIGNQSRLEKQRGFCAAGAEQCACASLRRSGCGNGVELPGRTPGILLMAKGTGAGAAKAVARPPHGRKL